MKQIMCLLALFCLACDPIENTPELVSGLRAFGVGTEFAAYTYSTDEVPVDVKITFYLASSIKADIEAEAIEIEADQLELTNKSIEHQDYSELRVFSVSFTARLPGLDELVFSPVDDMASVPYGMVFTQGAEEEKVRGRMRIVRPTSPALELARPSIKIVSPTDDSQISDGELLLRAEIDRTFDEFYRSSWLVADGEIPRPRALETTWENMSPGTKTIIATTRGLSSWNFNFEVIDVEIR